MKNVRNVLEIFGEPISNGGEEAFVMNILQNMDLNGMQVDVLTPYYCDNDYYRTLLEKQGSRIYCFSLPFTPGKSRNNIWKPLRKHLKERRYDVVHIHSGSISVLALGALAAKLGGVKKILVHSHCAAESETWRYRIVKTIFTPALLLCPDVYCACSKIAGEWKFPSAVSKKTRILKNGVDLKKYSFNMENRTRLRKELGISDHTFVMGHVGRFSYQKNHEFLIEIFEKVKACCPDCCLLMIGSGETQENIRQMVMAKGLQENVLWLGNVNNVWEYLSVMDAFVLPSRFEGLPLAGVEALTNGLPLIVSDRVSDELALTPEVCFCPLEQPAQEWAEKVLEYGRAGRKDHTAELKQQGYDVRKTAGEIRNLYTGEK